MAHLKNKYWCAYVEVSTCENIISDYVCEMKLSFVSCCNLETDTQELTTFVSEP